MEDNFEKKKLMKLIPFFFVSALCVVLLLILVLSIKGLVSGDKERLPDKSMYADSVRINKKAFSARVPEELSPAGRRLFASLFPGYPLAELEDDAASDKVKSAVEAAVKDETALIYMNKYAEKAEKLAEKLRNDERFTTYELGKLLDEQYTYDTAASIFLGEDSKLTAEQLKIIYVLCTENPEIFEEDEPEMSLRALMAFSTSVESSYPLLYRGLENYLSQLRFLSAHDSAYYLNEKMTTAEAADFFSFDKSRIEELFEYYNTSDEKDLPKLTLPALSDFLINNVLDNTKFFEKIDKPLRADIQLFSKFADRNLMTRTLGYGELAELLETSEASVLAVIKLKDGLAADSSDLPSFVNYLLDNSESGGIISTLLDEKTLYELKMLKKIITLVMAGTAIDYKETAEIFGIKEDLTKQLFEYKYDLDLAENPPEKAEISICLSDFIHFLANEAPNYQKAGLPSGSKEQKKYLSYSTVVDLLTFNQAYPISELVSDLSVFYQDSTDTSAKPKSECFDTISLLLYARNSTVSVKSLSLSTLEAFDPEGTDALRKYSAYLLGADTTRTPLSDFNDIRTQIKNVHEMFESDTYYRMLLTFNEKLGNKEQQKVVKEYYESILDKYSDTDKIMLYNESILKFELRGKYVRRIGISALLLFISLLVWFGIAGNMRHTMMNFDK